jgi:hypothetical protein
VCRPSQSAVLRGTAGGRLRTSILTSYFVGLSLSLLFVSHWWVARRGEREASAGLSRQTQPSPSEDELADTVTGTEWWQEPKRSLDDHEASLKAIHAAYAAKRAVFGAFLLGIGLGMVIAASAFAQDYRVAIGAFAALLLGVVTGVFAGMVAAIVYQLFVGPLLGRGSQRLRRLYMRRNRHRS